MTGWPHPHAVEIVTDGDAERGSWSSLVNDYTTWVVQVDHDESRDNELPPFERSRLSPDEGEPDVWPDEPSDPDEYHGQPRYLRTDGFVR